jgi:hypothetical protein
MIEELKGWLREVREHPVEALVALLVLIFLVNIAIK